MTRVKNSPAKRARHHVVLNRTKGFRMTKHRLWKVAHEAYLHALDYSFKGRKDRKSDFRTLWIIRINAALRLLDPKFTYGNFIHAATTKNVQLDRKILADLAVSDPATFATIVKQVHN
ncbi:MAG: 50S ribosomal protein L20 [Microgenomates group bacterium GW2011_GWC2_46_7]|nr:MAG: 50S ribosomal protein L20 [Microgenomates group bacterium GW2011_GWC2_46_7]